MFKNFKGNAATGVGMFFGGIIGFIGYVIQSIMFLIIPVGIVQFIAHGTELTFVMYITGLLWSAGIVSVVFFIFALVQMIRNR